MTRELELKYMPIIQSKHRSGIRAFDCRKTIIINVLFMHVYRIQLTCICTYRRNNVVLGKKTIFKIMYFSSVAAMYYLLLKKRVVPDIDKLGISLHPGMLRAYPVCVRWILVRSNINIVKNLQGQWWQTREDSFYQKIELCSALESCEVKQGYFKSVSNTPPPPPGFLGKNLKNPGKRGKKGVKPPPQSF